MEVTKDFLKKLVEESSSVLNGYYRNIKSIDYKSDKSPVTEADKAVEQKLRDIISDKFPEHGIQGEEFGVSNPESAYRWFLDPIDGTKSFMIGRPTFGTLIALTYEEEAIMGVINQPITKDCWIGIKGEGSTLNGNIAETRNCKILSDAVLCTTGPNYFSQEKLDIFNMIAKESHYEIYGGDCYSYGLLSSGLVDIVMESQLKPHDYMAFIPIIEEAGGIITDWQGEKLNSNSNGDVIACATKDLHNQILALINNI